MKRGEGAENRKEEINVGKSVLKESWGSRIKKEEKKGKADNEKRG